MIDGGVLMLVVLAMAVLIAVLLAIIGGSL